MSLLRKQNAETSNALLDHFGNSPAFARLAAFEGDLTVRRDQEGAGSAPSSCLLLAARCCLCYGGSSPLAYNHLPRA
jgi:hypothetical protein